MNFEVSLYQVLIMELLCYIVISFIPAVHCPALTDPPNGNVNQKGNRPGDRATYSCNTNYILSGDRTRTCQNDGSWSVEAPTCERLGMFILALVLIG